MVNNNDASYKQLSFDDLLKQLDEHPDEAIRLPVDPDDIGGELLALLSKGLYTNPLDCIREYVQNAVDARATDVIIKITGNSVLIYDNGMGMNLEDLLLARQFGLSPKLISENVGFRGIGIYSAFDLCQRLRISSKKVGDRNQYVMTFEFAAMRSDLERGKHSLRKEDKVSLIRLLSEHTYIQRDSTSQDSELHFTLVELQDISDVHIKQISNRIELRRYLLQNLPIDFSDEFAHKKVVNQQLQLHVPAFNPIRITLQSDTYPDEVVEKENIPNLRPPTYGYITTTTGQQVAYYWACLNAERQRINANLGDKSRESEIGYEGFVYKVKGFTIGDRNKLRTMFTRKPQLYPWYTGEIYVLDDNVLPNAERNDFETNQYKRALESAVRRALENLEDEAEEIQAQSLAAERISKYQNEIAKVESLVQANEQENDFKTYSALSEILSDLKRQKQNAAPEMKKVAGELVKRIERVQAELSKQAENPIPEANRRKRAAKEEHLPKQEPLQVLTEAPKTLHTVLSDAGWTLEGDYAWLLNIIQESLEEVLATNSRTYINLLNLIEAKLLDNSAEN